MTETPNTSNTTAADAFDGHSVIAVSFEDDATAYKALTLLEELDSQHRIGVREAVVVARGEDGQIVAKDRVESSSLPGTATGGLIGLLIGVIGGPLGVLIGGTYGLFVGSLFDIYDADESDSALGEISGSVKIGHTALLAVVDEQSTEVVDAAMADLDGTVARRSVAVVEAEIAAAEDAERKAKREARKELNRARRERNKAAVDAKLDELKSKLHQGQRTASAEADDAAAAPAGTARWAEERHMEDTIVTLRYTELGRARRALHELKRLDRERRLQVRGATLVQRSGQGGIDAPPAARDDDGHYLPPGGTVSMLLDVLGGPLGVLWARPSESFRRHGGGSRHEGERELALEEISRSLEPGVTLVIAEIADPDPDVLDPALASLGGTVTRRPASDVYAEVQTAEAQLS